jgi:hypothetical protein
MSTALIHCRKLQDVTYVVTHKFLSKFISIILILLFPNSGLNAGSSFKHSEIWNWYGL